MTIVLGAGTTPTGVGFVQTGGTDPVGRYLYVVSQCCEAELVTTLEGGKIRAQRCGSCNRELEKPWLEYTRLDMSQQRERMLVEEFVAGWGGFNRDDFEVTFEHVKPV